MRQVLSSFSSYNEHDLSIQTHVIKHVDDPLLVPAHVSEIKKPT